MIDDCIEHVTAEGFSYSPAFCLCIHQQHVEHAKPSFATRPLGLSFGIGRYFQFWNWHHFSNQPGLSSTRSLKNPNQFWSQTLIEPFHSPCGQNQVEFPLVEFPLVDTMSSHVLDQNILGSPSTLAMFTSSACARFLARSLLATQVTMWTSQSHVHDWSSCKPVGGESTHSWGWVLIEILVLIIVQSERCLKLTPWNSLAFIMISWFYLKPTSHLSTNQSTVWVLRKAIDCKAARFGPGTKVGSQCC